MQPIGINPLLTVSLIFGFIAKEVQIGALAVLYGLSDNALGEKIGQTITATQGYSYCIFSLLYVPCLTTISVMLAESKSSKFTGFAVGFSLIVAWVASLLFYQTARLLGFE
jgi:ferrous iron transport protein B